MVDEIKEILSSQYGIETGGSLDGTREIDIGGRERRLPHLGEFVKDIRDGFLIGHVIHEDDDAFAAQDHFRQCGPLVEFHGDVGGFVEVVAQTGVEQGVCVVAHVYEIAVDDQDCHDVVGMRL